VVGGHYWEVAVDEASDNCGSRRGTLAPKRLAPNDECQTRKGIAAYPFDGLLDPDWAPEYSGSYSLVWALHAEGSTLHTGGQFKQVQADQRGHPELLRPALASSFSLEEDLLIEGRGMGVL
jgi:hypothetical protein